MTPPAANGGDSKSSGVMIGSNIHKSGVSPQIIDAIGISPRHRRIGKIVSVHPFCSFLSTPLPPLVFKVADDFLFLRVHRNHRSPLRQSQPHFLVDVPELGIPVRMIFPLLGLAVALQTVV